MIKRGRKASLSIEMVVVAALAIIVLAVLAVIVYKGIAGNYTRIQNVGDTASNCKTPLVASRNCGTGNPPSCIPGEKMITPVSGDKWKDCPVVCCEKII